MPASPYPRPHRVVPTVVVGALLAASVLVGSASAATSDTDGDGLPNSYEQLHTKTDPTRSDSDRDGMPDGREDSDHDRLTNITEFRAGTDPLDEDTDNDRLRDDLEDADGDGINNRTEQLAGTDPGVTDTDHDGLIDRREDSDTDGLTNRREQDLGTNPGVRDTDNDGHTDGDEVGAGTNPLDSKSPVPVAPNVPGSTCPIFPINNVWNTRIGSRPVASNSATMIAAIGLDRGLHMDFGSYAGYGIPYQLVTSATPRSTVAFEYDDESDAVGYPIPSSPKIEGGSDRHILMIDKDACRLYELFAAAKANGQWSASSGATWDLRSNSLRPAGWTSADAAGLPILPGLVRYDEVAAGVISHALRFTTNATRKAYLYPARHFASSSTSTSLPPMGLRVRLKATFDVTALPRDARVIAVALQRYGMILADNGSPWYISGMSDPHFDDDILHKLDRITGRDLEVVDTTGLVNGS